MKMKNYWLLLLVEGKKVGDEGDGKLNINKLSHNLIIICEMRRNKCDFIKVEPRLWRNEVRAGHNTPNGRSIK